MSPRIIVVGAGASGISAASRLFDNGFSNITILEAEDRIGGRIYTKSFGDGVVDLGAHFCREGSIVNDLIGNLSLLQKGNLEKKVYHSKYGCLPESFLKTLSHRINQFLQQSKPDCDSWKQHILEQFTPTLVDYFENDSDKLLAKDCINFVEKTFIHLTGAISLDDPSESWSKEYPPNFKLVWKAGYKCFLDFLIKTYLEPKALSGTDNTIALNMKVKTIEWGDQSGCVKLTCSDGSIFTADHVIITISLGALKKQHNSLFSPALSLRKQQAIELIGFGSSLKIAYYFSEKWWDNHNFMFAWSEDDLNSVDFKQGPSKNGQSWITNFTGFYLVPNNPNILMAWYVGELIPEVELCNNDVLLDGAFYILQKFLGQTYTNITKPTKLVFNNWYSNPHFGGVSSYPSVESKRKGVTGEDLAEPILINGVPRLLFAGEATTNTAFGCVNGAVLSGLREANRIINFYKQTS